LGQGVPRNAVRQAVGRVNDNPYLGNGFQKVAAKTKLRRLAERRENLQSKKRSCDTNLAQPVRQSFTLVELVEKVR
jgi:hypothetical protein